MESQEFVEALKVLSDETRIRILKILEEKPSYLCQITAVLGFSPSTVSTHLSKLKQFGFVKDKREGAKVLFSLSEPESGELRRILSEILNVADSWQVVRKDLEKLKKASLKEVCPYE